MSSRQPIKAYRVFVRTPLFDFNTNNPWREVRWTENFKSYHVCDIYPNGRLVPIPNPYTETLCDVYTAQNDVFWLLSQWADIHIQRIDT